jgi:hypothetical protein
MRSARAPAKVQPSLSSLPYGSVSHTRHQHHRHAASLLSRVARRVGATVTKLSLLRRWNGETAAQHAGTTTRSCEDENGALCASSSSPAEVGVGDTLQPGDVLRDLPCFTSTAEVTFLSTHPVLCADVFGLVPGEVLETMGEGRAGVPGQLLVVVGARGGKLYVLGAGEAVVRPLHVPVVSPAHQSHVWSTTETSPSRVCPSSSSASAVRAAILKHYAAHTVFHPERSLTAAEKAAAASVHGALSDMNNREGSLVELQQELAARVAQVHADVAALTSRARAEGQRVYTAEQRSFLQRAPDLYVAVCPAPRTQWTQRDTLSDATAAAVSSTVSQAAPPSAASVYAAVAQSDAVACAVVLLPPRIIAATGTVGWVGEGDVVVPASQTGTDGNAGSLSASIVI